MRDVAILSDMMASVYEGDVEWRCGLGKERDVYVNVAVCGSCVWHFSALPQRPWVSANQGAYDDSILVGGRAGHACAEGRRPPLPGSFLLPPIPDDLHFGSQSGRPASHISTKLADESEIAFCHVVVAILYPDLACQSPWPDLVCRSLCLLTRMARGIILIFDRRVVNSIQSIHISMLT
jgi:hypothetical protein